VINLADRVYYKMAIQTRDFAIGDYAIGKITQRPALSYGYPLLDSSGQLSGVVVLTQNLNWLTSALANVTFPPGAVLMVTDRNGTVLARMPDAGDWIGKVMPDARILEAVSDQRDGGVFEATDAQGVARLWAHAPLIAGQDLHATMGHPRRTRSPTSTAASSQPVGLAS
jgi:hypothetical protein